MVNKKKKANIILKAFLNGLKNNQINVVIVELKKKIWNCTFMKIIYSIKKQDKGEKS
jgi:hypothetical protein